MKLPSIDTEYENDCIKNIMIDVLGEINLNDEKEELYRKTVSSFIVNKNSEKFIRLIKICMSDWGELLKNKVINRPNYEVLAHSLHYKSPSFGTWFRWPHIFQNGKEIFKQDVTLLKTFDNKYLEIPEDLNVSLEVGKPFDKIVTISTIESSSKIQIKKDMVLPFKKIKEIDRFLREKSLDDLIDYGRELTRFDYNNAIIIKALQKGREVNWNETEFNSQFRNELTENEKTIFMSQEILNKIFELTKLQKYFQIDDNYKKLKDSLRLILSGYIVFRSYQNIKDKIDHNKKLVILIFPLKGAISALKKEGSWLIFLSIPKNDTFTLKNIRNLKSNIQEAWSLIRGYDLNSSLQVNHRYWSLELERLMREIISIRSEIINKENETAKNVMKSISIQTNDHISIDKQENLPDEVKKRLKVIKGKNQQFIEFLHKLKMTAILAEPKEKDSKLDAKVISIFLYSEPGTGKETLAYLIHLWARAQFKTSSHLKDGYKDKKKKLYKEFIDKNESLNDKGPFKFPYGKDDPNQTARTDKEIIDEEISKGFFSINCSLLDSNNFSRLLFGCNEKPNGVLTAAAYSGTCFFDEFNTLELRLENRLLRLLDKPNEALIFEEETDPFKMRLIKNIKCIYIFASNKTPNELIKMGYNSAVISRISQYYFEVPPLRKRKEDLILSFVDQLILYQEDTKWETVSPQVLQFLCMLSWEGNFRSLKGFVGDLANERILRGITNKELNFREVVECAVRRKLLGE